MPDNEERDILLPGEALPPVISPPVAKPEVEPEVGEEPKDELDELFEVPQEGDNDMATDGLFEVTEEDVMGDKVVEEESETFKDLTQVTDEEDEHYFGTKDEQNDGDMSDLTEVTQEDIFGTPPKPRVRVTGRGRRFVRRETPPTRLQGLR